MSAERGGTRDLALHRRPSGDGAPLRVRRGRPELEVGALIVKDLRCVDPLADLLQLQHELIPIPRLTALVAKRASCASPSLDGACVR